MGCFSKLTGGRAAVLAVALSLACATASRPAVAAEPKPKVALSPANEARLAELLKKGPVAKRKAWQTRMKLEIERVTKATGLGADGAKALEGIATECVESCLGSWTAMVEEGWRTFFNEQSGAEEEGSVVMESTEEAASVDWYGEYDRPYEAPKWEEGLRKTLSGEQFAGWKKLENERVAAVMKESAPVIKFAVARASDSQRRALLAKVAAMKRTLTLSKEREATLEALARTAVDAVTEELRKRAERMLASMDEEQRKKMLNPQEFYLGLEPNDLKRLETTWKEGVARVLTAEEVARLEASREDAQVRRAAAIGRIFLAQMDEKVAFTAQQRERLEPIARRLVKDQKQLFPDVGQGDYYRVDPQHFLAAGARASKDEMLAILDARQWKNWQEICDGKSSPTGRVRVAIGGRNATPAPTPKPGTGSPEPEALEHAFSDYFQKQSTAERQRLLAFHILQAEDAGRVAGLAPEALARLETAARGRTEEALARWKTTNESSVRSQLSGVTVENVQQRLASMEGYSTRTIGGKEKLDPVWERSVKTELTEEGRAAWERELAARSAYRHEAIAAFLLAEFDRKVPLSTEQWGRLETLIAGVVKDYTPDIEMMFSSTSQWYLQSYTMFLPFAAVPEKELQAILTKEKAEQWAKSNEMSNVSSYWENVQRYHSQRLGTKKP